MVRDEEQKSPAKALVPKRLGLRQPFRDNGTKRSGYDPSIITLGER